MHKKNDRYNSSEGIVLRTSLTIYKSYIMTLPIFLLTLGCGINKGGLIAVAVIVHLILCRIYKTPVLGSMWQSPLFKKSWLFMAVFIGTMVFSWLFNHGNMQEIGNYAERMIPFLVFGLIARNEVDVPRIVWYGTICSVVYIGVDTLFHPNYLGGRLMGAFGWPLSMASVLVVLLPVILFGISMYWKEQPVVSVMATLTFFAGGYLVALTGARSAAIALGIVLLGLLFFMIKTHNWKMLKVVVPLLLLISFTVAGFFSSEWESRFHNPLQTDGRIYLMQVSQQIFQEHPLVGIGVKEWGTVYHDRFELPGREKNMQSPHNIFLHSLNESGLIGLGGFLLLLGFQFSRLIRSGLAVYRKHDRKLEWTAGMLLTLLSIIVFGQFDYAFFGRYGMHLFWLSWGLAVYVLQEKKNS